MVTSRFRAGSIVNGCCALPRMEKYPPARTQNPSKSTDLLTMKRNNADPREDIVAVNEPLKRIQMAIVSLFDPKLTEDSCV